MAGTAEQARVWRIHGSVAGFRANEVSGKQTGSGLCHRAPAPGQEVSCKSTLIDKFPFNINLFPCSLCACRVGLRHPGAFLLGGFSETVPSVTAVLNPTLDLVTIEPAPRPRSPGNTVMCRSLARINDIIRRASVIDAAPVPVPPHIQDTGVSDLSVW